MANLNDILNGLVNINSKMANNINNLLDSIGEGFLDIGELTVKNDILSLQGATILINGSNILMEDLSTTFTGNKICFLEYKEDKSISLKVLSVVDENFNYDLSQLSTTSKHFEVARQYNGVLEDRRIASMASKDNTIVGALSGALKAIDYDDEIDLEINMDILSRISLLESDIQGLEYDIQGLENTKVTKQYVDEAIANNVPEIDGMVKAVDVGEVEDIENPYVTREELDEILDGNTGGGGSNNDDLTTTDKTIVGAINEVNNLTQYLNNVVFNHTTQIGTDTLSTNSQTLSGAINELFQSANNGKELIASSIGEPLSSEQTFNAMSNDINGLLSTFKTNMMKNGITVEGGDKFKQLIDKISTMVEEGSGKGIQFASGKIPNITTQVNETKSISLPLNGLTFQPTYLFITIKTIAYDFGSSSYDTTSFILDNIITTSTAKTKWIDPNNGRFAIGAYISNITNASCTLTYVTETALSSMGVTGLRDIIYYAIGVGEEDTTLRDSLASILQDSGINVTEEDDMASLITKVDTEFDEATSNKNRLYDLMLEGGYEVNNSMSLDSLLDLLEQSGISVGDIEQIEIACGTYYTFILKTDGSLWCCGQNNYGQLGLGDTSSRNTFTQVTTNINNDVTQVACGDNHTIIQKKDGTLWGCGLNTYGQLGLGNNTNQTTFTRITNNINNDVKQIACGFNHTFVLKNDGSLWGCGYNSYGQLGLNNTTDKTSFTQVTPNINNDVKQIACGTYHTVILKTDGSLWGCGYNYYNQLGLSDSANKHMFVNITTNINNDVKQIACGQYHTFILKNDGSIWGCGYNLYGQLGLSHTNDMNTFTKVVTNINSEVKQIACGFNYTFIIKNDGSLWACGRNNYGQLGLNSVSDKTTFTQVTKNISNDVKQISCGSGSEHTFIIKTDGSLWSCGRNNYGQLGLNTSNDRIIFTQVPRGF